MPLGWTGAPRGGGGILYLKYGRGREGRGCGGREVGDGREGQGAGRQGGGDGGIEGEKERERKAERGGEDRPIFPLVHPLQPFPSLYMQYNIK